MPSSIALRVEVHADPAGAFDAFAEELARWAAGQPEVAFEPGPEGRFGHGGRVTAWERGRRIGLEWAAAEWEKEARSVDIRFEPVGTGTRITVEHADFGRPLEEFSGGEGEAASELVGWFVDAVAGPSLAAASPAGLGDWLVNRFARRPTGARARSTYADPTEHRPGFAATLHALALGPDDHVLELGCGGGAFMQDALETGCTAVGLDHSEEMVRLTERQNARAVAEGRLQVMRGDAAESTRTSSWSTSPATPASPR